MKTPLENDKNIVVFNINKKPCSVLLKKHSQYVTYM